MLDMDKEDFFEEWKKDWEERKEEFNSYQAELFRRIMGRKTRKRGLRSVENVGKAENGTLTYRVTPAAKPFRR